MTHNIIGDRNRTSAYDPGLAERMNRQVEEELRQEELARRLEEARRKREPAAPRIEPPSAPAVVQPAGGLEIIEGNYLQAIQAAVPESIQTSAEIQKVRVYFTAKRDTSLNTVGFYTTNVPLYSIENGKPFFLFGGREAFLILYAPHFQEVYNQIIDAPNHVYTLPEADKVWALNEGLRSGALKRFDLAELIETMDDLEYGHFKIITTKSNKLKGPRRELAELIHGSGDDYLAVMELLARNKIKETKVFLLTLGYVNLNAGKNLIGRASWLNGFYGNSYFNAIDRDVGLNNHLRGVRRVVVRASGRKK